MKFLSNLSLRKKEVLLTVASNLSLQVVTALCGFILPPLIIGTFGSSVNGMVSSISQFIAYLNIVEAGVGGASIAALYKPLSLGDVAGRNGILSATAKFYNRSGVLFTVLVFVLAFVYPLIVRNEVDRLQSALMVLVLGITGAAEFFLIGKYRVLLTADKKIYVISLVQMAAVVINTFVAVVIIKAGFGILIVKLVSALVYLSRYIVLSLYVHKKYSELNFHTTPDTQAISQSKNVLVLQICGVLVFNSPIILITIFCTLSDASIYAVYCLVFTAVGNLLKIFLNGMQSFFGESLVKGTLADTQRIYSRYESFYFAIESWLYSIACLLAMSFLSIYTKKMTDANYNQPLLSLLFCALGITDGIRNIGFQLIHAAGHYKKTQNYSIIEAVFCIFASVFFAHLIGLYGILLGSILTLFLRGIEVLVYVHKNILKNSPIMSFAKIILAIALFAPVTRILALFLLSVNSYGQWLVLAVIVGVLMLIPFGLYLVVIQYSWRKQR